MGFGFLESLEARVLFSALPMTADFIPDAQGPADAVFDGRRVAERALLKVKGAYTGRSYNGQGSLRITLTITSQKSNGNFAGRITSPDSQALSLKVRGKLSSGRTITFTFAGSGSDGPVNGTGTGKFSRDGKSLSGAYHDDNGGNGTLKVRKS